MQMQEENLHDKEKMNIFMEIIKSRAVLKCQQKNEPDLSDSEKLQILDNLYQNDFVKFLEKYSQFIDEKNVDALRHRYEMLKNGISESRRKVAEFYLNEIGKPTKSKQAKVKNRRYEAMQRLIRQGEYFSDEAMRARDPLLYQQMVEKFDTQQIDLSAENEQPRGYLTDFLMKHLESFHHGERITSQEAYESNQIEESDDDEEEENEEEENEEEKEEEDEEEIDEDLEKNLSAPRPSVASRSHYSAQEKANIRDEFVSIMHRRFLNGEDNNFDYNAVDFNEDYDNIEIESRDKEESYFDELDEDEAIDVNKKEMRSDEYDF